MPFLAALNDTATEAIVIPKIFSVEKSKTSETTIPGPRIARRSGNNMPGSRSAKIGFQLSAFRFFGLRKANLIH